MSVSVANVGEAKARTTRITKSTEEFAKFLQDVWKIKVSVPLTYTRFREWLTKEMGNSRSSEYQIIALAQLEELVTRTNTSLPETIILSDSVSRAVTAHGGGVILKLRETATTPDTGKVETEIDTKKSATQFDSHIDGHERKIQLNHLYRAKTGVIAGVPGGDLRTWKNIRSAVRSKIAKRVVAAGLAGVMIFSLAGCFANDVPNPHGPDGPTNVPQEYGDAAGNGTTVTDEYGTYEPLTVNPDSKSAQIREAGIDQTVYDAGYTNEDVQAAQYFASKMVVEQFLDSSALDTGAAGYANWQSTVAPEYFYPDVAASMAPGAGHTNLTINTSTLNAVPQLVRDGKPRISSVSLSVDRVYSENKGGIQFIGFEYSFNVDYRASDVSILDLSKKVTGLSEQDLASTLKPEIFDSAGENRYNAYGSINLGVKKQENNTYKSAGATSYYYYDTQTYTQ